MNHALRPTTPILRSAIPTPLRLVHSASHARITDASVLEQAHLLWDRLADFDATEVDAALDLLLRGLCKIADAENACWLRTLPTETRQGAHPPAVRILRSTRQDRGFHSEFCREHHQDGGLGDVIYADFPVNDGAESCFGIFRNVGRPPFSLREREAVAHVLRGIKWFHRRLVLSYGLLFAESPLTAVERRVLKHLLGGLAEKQIAAEVGHSVHTTHEYVRNIYRKFRVNNRATLMALWLGKKA